MSENFTENDRALLTARRRKPDTPWNYAIRHAIAEIDSLRAKLGETQTELGILRRDIAVGTLGMPSTDETTDEDRIDWLCDGFVKAAEERDSLRAQLGEAQKQRDELGHQLEFDRSAVAGCLTAANRAIDSRHWLTEGRGCYEWNDDRWHDEFRAAALEIKARLEPLTKIAENWAGCPVKAPEIAAARIDLKRQNDTLRSEVERTKAALRLIQWGGERSFPFCPKCKRFDRDGHAPDCEVGAALAGGATNPPTWQPMETAPRNGTVILVWRIDAGVFTAHFVLSADGESENWFTTAGEDISGDEQPTLWMPLPGGPAQSETGGAA